MSSTLSGSISEPSAQLAAGQEPGKQKPELPLKRAERQWRGGIKRRYIPRDPENYRQWFMESVEKTQTCWFWKRSLTSGNGFGSCEWIDGSQTTPSRIMWIMTHGSVPKTSFVLSECGNRHCVNPSHLRLEKAVKRIDSIEQKFWKRVEKTDGCWLFKGAIGTHGYGRLHIGGNKLMNAHRVSWMVHFGEIPRGMLVCHHCDNPPCVRPDHLFLGTYADNVADMDQKGRRVSAPRLGAQHHKAKLSDDDVIEIRKQYGNGTRIPAIASQFGISTRQVWRVATRRAWSHIP